MTMEQSSGRKWLEKYAMNGTSAGLTPTRGKSPQPGVFWSARRTRAFTGPKSYERCMLQVVRILSTGWKASTPILKNLGKGSSRENNISSVGICLDAGIVPIPNIIIGFPEETFQSIRPHDHGADRARHPR
jgi:anaerobic magnesium-protoporphyrin IX monomethyl ester cyclase